MSSVTILGHGDMHVAASSSLPAASRPAGAAIDLSACVVLIKPREAGQPGARVCRRRRSICANGVARPTGRYGTQRPCRQSPRSVHAASVDGLVARAATFSDARFRSALVIISLARRRRMAELESAHGLR